MRAIIFQKVDKEDSAAMKLDDTLLVKLNLALVSTILSNHIKQDFKQIFDEIEIKRGKLFDFIELKN